MTDLGIVLGDAGLTLDDGARQWVRWALLHSSYLYESVHDESMSPGALGILQLLGRNWMRLAMVEYVPTTRGDFTSSSDVSLILAQDPDARTAIAKWLSATGSGWYGRGERAAVDAGRGRSAEDVAMQVVGALALASGSTAPAVALLRACGFQAQEPDPDWATLIRTATGTDATVTRSESGPSHSRIFTVTATAAGKTAHGVATSVKAARMLALRAWVTEHAPRLVPVPRRPDAAAREPRPYPTPPPAHRDAVEWAGSAFEADAPGLFAQALTHRSWTHENRAVVAQRHQRDYGVLAAEGSELIRTLVHHHYALNVLSSPATVPASDLVSTSVTDEKVAELFDTLDLTAAVLCSRGMTLSPETKSDVIQALAAAAWRARPRQLAQRQVAELDEWVRSFVPGRDPATMLQEYGATHRIQFDYQFQSRGADHQRQFRARVTLASDNTEGPVGEWRTSKTDAKHSASGKLLHLLSGEDATELSEEEANVLRACLAAELRAVAPENPTAERDLLAGRMGLDWLAAGDYPTYLQWATARSRALPGSQSSVLARIGAYYAAALVQLRRARIRSTIKPLLPARHVGDRPGEATGTESTLGAWLDGQAPARLALVEDLLGAVVWQRNPYDAAIAFVQRQAAVIAAASHASVESTVTVEDTAKTLSIRVAERDLASAVAPLVEAVEAVVSGGTWVRDADTVALALATPPATEDPIAAAAFEAAASSWHDPWLGALRDALAGLLHAADPAAASGTAKALDEALVEVERVLWLS